MTANDEDPQSLVELRRELLALGKFEAEVDPSSELTDEPVLSELDQLARKLAELRNTGGQANREDLWNRIEPQLREGPSPAQTWESDS